MLRSRLGKIARDLDDEIDPGVRAGAELVAAAARMRVPVRSGWLRSSIHVEKEADGVYAVVAGNERAYYGHMVERRTDDTSAQPFLEPSLEGAEAAIPMLVAGTLEDA